ncbi:asparaginase domain-containing protein [Bacteroidota bacterium]
MIKIKFICVGGTIDKVYFDAKSKYEVGPPNIISVLKELNLAFKYSVESVLKKDSLDMKESDRELVYQKINSCVEDMIIITHGTDTMVETAKYLSKIKNKTIVLTGALEPAMFKTSDAVFNIGSAIAAVQSLKPDIYIAMNGRIYNHNNVRKNLNKNRFEEIS